MTIEIDGFDVEAEIGHGGFGVVYRARQIAFNRLVAIKVLHPGLSDEKLRKQFANECRAVGALPSHRNILGVYSTGTTADGRPYLAMQLLTGGSLYERMPLPVEQVRDLGIKLAGALRIAHAGGVVHRDVKPANVLFDDAGEAVLVDFGISSLVTDPSTTTSSIAVSIGYTAPEVLEGTKPAAAADVYALGATLFAAVTGRTPFVVEGGFSSIGVLAARILTQPVEDLRPAGVPEWLCRVIETAMAKDPAARYRSMAEVESALEQSADDTIRASPQRFPPPGQFLPADRNGPTTPIRHGRRFGRRWLIAAVIAVLVLGGAAALTAYELTGSSTKTFAAADLDCNGTDDFLAVGTQGDLDNVLLFYPRGKLPDSHPNGPPTTWTGPNEVYIREDPNFGAQTFVSLVLPGDLTGDGSPDLVGEKSDGSLWLMPGNCTGLFRAASMQEIAQGTGQVEVTAPGDVTGDGRPDLLAVDRAGHLILYAGMGNGKLAAGTAIATGWTSAIGVGDVNGDGRPDVIDRRADGSLDLYAFDARGVLDPRAVPLALTLPPSDFPYVIGGVDVSLGAHNDLVAIDRSSKLVFFAAESGAKDGGLFRSTCGFVGNGWGGSGIGDVAGVTAVPGTSVDRFVGGNPKCFTESF